MRPNFELSSFFCYLHVSLSANIAFVFKADIINRLTVSPLLLGEAVASPDALEELEEEDVDVALKMLVLEGDCVVGVALEVSSEQESALLPSSVLSNLPVYLLWSIQRLYVSSMRAPRQ